MEHYFEITYIISQVFAFVTFLLDITAIQQRKKVDLLKVDTAAAFCSLLHYAFLGAWSGMAVKIITTVRNGVAAYEAKQKKKSSILLPTVFVTLFIIASCFTYESAFSLLPMLAASIYTFAIYLGNASMIRRISVLTGVIWLIYDIFVFSIVGIIAQIILVINSLVAIYRYRKKKKKS